MTRPTAFVGAFTAVSPGLPSQPMVARITLPRGEFDPFVRSVGMPRWPDGPAIALLPCREPVHPVRDADVLALATARALNGLLAAGEVRLVPELLRELGVLAAAIGATAAGRRRDITAPPPAAPEAR